VPEQAARPAVAAITPSARILSIIVPLQSLNSCAPLPAGASAEYKTFPDIVEEATSEVISGVLKRRAVSV
jgi:hypothetical protein